MIPAERDFYTVQSPHSDPGPMAGRLADLPTDPGELAVLVRRLLLHREEAGRYGCVLPESRYRQEAETRFVADILRIVTGLDEAPVIEGRRPRHRFAGTCRDFALLHCALLRHTGTPARVRCGYAGYLAPGFHDDHWVTEYVHPERGWTLVDPQVVPDEEIQQPYDVDFDPLDVPRDAFLVAGDAWLRCRSGEADPEVFGVSVLGLTGMWMVRGNVVRDLAALNREEVLPWDAWGAGNAGPDGRSEADADTLALLDEAARCTRRGDFAGLRQLFLNTPELRLPDTVTSYTSYVGRREVRLPGQG